MTFPSQPAIPNPLTKTRIRELMEILVLVLIAVVILGLFKLWGPKFAKPLIWIVVLGALLKTIYYFAETLWHLVQATANDMPYHRFLLLMAYNMAEVTLSFALDFFCLQRLNPTSLTGMTQDHATANLFFDSLYFSILNFSFFGYGDITPTTIPAKIVMLLEVVTAFTTVIFLISDFVSMKDSMRQHRSKV